ncbi:hypothetical protein ME763_20120 [Streptomyces murinus]|uniref:hypothetical protein n=1 Tax=Streptomyces murinus TaxID=33900 RepID=UPI000A1EE3DC|nr:hypothetical protein [Streptomyces murinus]WDO07778.1 hypothetical protein ME763_20120 [Streptomyces murinus]
MTDSSMTRAGKRAVIIGTAAAAAAVGVLAVPAQASSWSSYISSAGNDFESRRWTDDGGSTTIKFTSCHRDGTQAVNVMLRKDTLGPDPKYSNQTFTNCFNSGATSTGNWDDHGSGDYYFVVDYGSNVYAPVSVSSVAVYY